MGICWFLYKNLSNFVSPVWKLHNPYCHRLQLKYIISTAWLRIWCPNRSLQLWLWLWWGERAFSWKRLQEISTPEFSTPDFSSPNFSTPNFSAATYINVIYIHKKVKSTIFQNWSQMFYFLLTNEGTENIFINLIWP